MLHTNLKIARKLNIKNVKYLCTVSLKSPIVSENNDQLKSWNEIPGPSTLPIVGQLHHFLPGGSLYKLEGYDMWKRLYDTYGKVVRLESIFKPPVLVLFDSDCIAQLFHSENSLPIRPAFFTLKYYRKEYNQTEERRLRPAGLVIDQGEEWKDMRKKVNPVLMMPNIVKMYTEVIDEVAVDMVERLKSLRDDKNMLRDTLRKEMNLWSLESIGTVALGRRLNCFDSILADDSPALTLIKNTHELFDVSDKLDYKPSIWRYYATPTFKKAMEVYANIERCTEFYVKKAIEDIKKGKVRNENEKSVLEKLIDIDENVAHVMANDLLIAGIDTTSNTALASLYLLAKSPDKQQKLREEISTEGLNGPYLKACLKESMRLMPTIGLNFRQTTKEYDILGYRVPKDTGFVFCHHVLSLMDSNYHKANEFIPERWLVEESDPLHYKKTHPFVSQPFGFGVRTCIGRRVAELEIHTLIARLVESFKIEWIGPPPKITFSHINYFKGPYNFIFNDVNNGQFHSKKSPY